MEQYLIHVSFNDEWVGEWKNKWFWEILLEFNKKELEELTDIKERCKNYIQKLLSWRWYDTVISILDYSHIKNNSFFIDWNNTEH